MCLRWGAIQARAGVLDAGLFCARSPDDRAEIWWPLPGNVRLGWLQTIHNIYGGTEAAVSARRPGAGQIQLTLPGMKGYRVRIVVDALSNITINAQDNHELSVIYFHQR